MTRKRLIHSKVVPADPDLSRALTFPLNVFLFKSDRLHIQDKHILARKHEYIEYIERLEVRLTKEYWLID